MAPRRTAPAYDRTRQLLTRLANQYWRAGRGRVSLAELLAIGREQWQRTADEHDPRSQLFEHYLAPRLHRALERRVASVGGGRRSG